jgi:beta-glucosidase-like glycosyl hydrolase
MKAVSSFVSVSLVSFLSISPSFALNQSSNRLVTVANTELNSSTNFNDPILNEFTPQRDVVANTLNSIIRAAERQQQRAERARAVEERKQALELQRQRNQEAAQKQQEQRELQKAAAAEKLRIAQEKERKYLESLTPEEKKAYIARQQEQRERQAEANRQLASDVVKAIFTSPRVVCRSGNWITGYTYYDC